MKFVCDRCPSTEGTTTTVEDWLSHLISDLHHLRYMDDANDNDINANISWKDSNNMDKWEWDVNRNQKAIVLSNIPQKANSSVIIKHFSKYGFVTDFYMEPNMKLCIVEYDCNMAVNDVMSVTNVINGKKLNVQRKSDVIDSNWSFLLELPNQNQSFLLNHLHIEAKVSSMDFKDQLLAFMELSKTEVGDVQSRARIVDELLAILKTRYPYCALYPMGSFKTSLFDKDCPFEIQVDPFGMLKTVANHNINFPPSPPETFYSVFSKILDALQTHMTQEKAFCIQVTSDREMDLESSIRFIHNKTGVECILRFNAIRDVQLSHLILFLLQIDSIVYPFLHFVLYWTRFNNFHKEMNKAILMLCIVYLNQKEILPSLSFLQSLVPPSLVQCWNVTFCNNLEYVRKILKKNGDGNDIQTTKNVLSIVQEFFELCSTTDFKKYVVCSNTGERLPRELFICGQEYRLPHTMNAYKCWRQALGPSHFLNVETPLCIQNPFHLGVNDSSKIQADVMERFQKEATETVRNIKIILSNEDPNLMRAFSESQIGPRFVRNVNGKSGQPSVLGVMDTPSVSSSMSSISITTSTEPDEFASQSHIVALKKMIRIKTNKRFVENFNDRFGQDEQPDILIQKRKVLLTTFMWDFLSIVWGKCFYMQAEVEEISEKDARFSDFEHLLRGKFLHRYNPRMIIEECKENPIEESVSDKKHVDLMNYLIYQESGQGKGTNGSNVKTVKKIQCLPTQIRNNFCRLISVSGLQDAWSSRHKIKKVADKKEMTEVCDPMIEEENITKQILSSQQVDKDSILSFTCTALVDTRDENPILYLALKDASSKPSLHFPQAANYLSLVFGNMIKGYTMFRLDQWMRNGESD